MMLFWDTSAVLATVLREPHSDAAQEAARASSCSYAWNWLKVEAESALARRGATPTQWAALAALLGAIRFDDIPSRELSTLCARNRGWRLRAADAGHLYCFTRVATVIPEIQLVGFDEEMLAVARRLKLPIWAPSPPAVGKAGRVREASNVHRARRKRG